MLLTKKQGTPERSGVPLELVQCLQNAGIGSLGALLANHVEIADNRGLKALDFGQVLIPHLGIGEHGMDQVLNAVLTVCIVELERPAVI